MEECFSSFLRFSSLEKKECTDTAVPSIYIVHLLPKGEKYSSEIITISENFAVNSM